VVDIRQRQSDQNERCRAQDFRTDVSTRAPVNFESHTFRTATYVNDDLLNNESLEMAQGKQGSRKEAFWDSHPPLLEVRRYWYLVTA